MESKHESDLTPKEKRRLEIEKIGALHGMKKLQYLWTYYKSVLLIAVIAAVVCSIAVTAWRNAHRNPYLTILAVGVDPTQADNLEVLAAELKGRLDQEKQYDPIELDTSIQTTVSVQDVQKMQIILAADEALDIIICPQEIYDAYRKEGVFDELSSPLSDYASDLLRSRFWKKEYVPYEPVCFGIRSTSSRKEHAGAFLEEMFKEPAS